MAEGARGDGTQHMDQASPAWASKECHVLRGRRRPWELSAQPLVVLVLQ